MAPATSVMGSTAARVSTNHRDTGSRARPVGGLVVRSTSTQADPRLCVAGDCVAGDGVADDRVDGDGVDGDGGIGSLTRASYRPPDCIYESGARGARATRGS